MDHVDGGWRPMRHSEFQEWASLELGDTRHVFARDQRLPDDAPLVFMPDNEAERFYQDAYDKHLVCPVRSCPYPYLRTRHVATRRDHFFHLKADQAEHPNYVEAVAQQILHRWAASLDPRFEVLDDQIRADIPISVLVRLPGGVEVALCYVGGVLGADAWWERYTALERAGVASAWIFAPRRQYFSRPEPQSQSSASDSEHSDSEAAELALDRPLFKTMRETGSWPLIINLEQQALANLVPTGGKIASKMRLAEPRLEDVLHIVISPLADCRLCKDGIVTLALNEKNLEKIRHGEKRERRPRYRTKRAPAKRNRPYDTYSGSGTRDTPTASPAWKDSETTPSPVEPPAEQPIERPPDLPSPPATESPFIPRQPPPRARAGTGSRGSMAVGLGICVVLAAIVLYAVNRATSSPRLSALQKQEHSLLADASATYSNCSKGKDDSQSVTVTCYIDPSEAEEQEIVYVELRPNAPIAALDQDYDTALKRHKMGYCISIGSTGWRMANRPDQGTVSCGAEGLIWCDRPARLTGAIYVKTEEGAQASERAALGQLPQAVNVLNPGQNADFEPDAHPGKC